jgi:LAO/AO transport system kinase
VLINKADGTNRAAAEKARCEAQNALHYFPSSPSGWTPRALKCSAQTGKEIPEIWDSVLEYAALIKANGWFSVTRTNQKRQWMHEIIQLGLLRRFESHPSVQKQLVALEQEVEQGQITSFRAARTLLEIYAASTPASPYCKE